MNIPAFVLPLVSLAITGGGLRAQGAEEHQVRAVGLSVVWDDMAESMDGFRTLNHEAGLKLVLALEAAGGKRLIAVDAAGSEVELMVDGEGNELVASFGHFPRLSEDGSVARLELSSEQVPASLPLAVSGRIAATFGGGSSSVAAEATAFEEGVVLDFEDRLKLEISKVEESQWQEGGLSVGFKAAVDLKFLSGLSFALEDGTAIEARRTGTSRMEMQGVVEMTETWTLDSTPEGPVVVTAGFWEDLEEVELPFELVMPPVGG